MFDHLKLNEILSHCRGRVWTSVELFESVLSLPSEVSEKKDLDLALEVELSDTDLKQFVILNRKFDEKFFWQMQAQGRDILLLPYSASVGAISAYFPGVVVLTAAKEEKESAQQLLEWGCADIVISSEQLLSCSTSWDLQSVQEWTPSEIQEHWQIPGRVLFLDRDNVIVHDVPYNKDPEKVELRLDVIELIQKANSLSIPVMMVSNQSGVGRGILSCEEFHLVHQRMLRLLSEKGLYLTESHWAFYHSSRALAEEVFLSMKRKPRGGMFFDIQERFDFSESSIMVGDKASDLFAAYWAGVKDLFLLAVGDSLKKEQEALEEFKKFKKDFSYKTIQNLGEVLNVL